MNLEVYNSLQKEDLKVLNRKLLAYAHIRLKHLTWQHQHEGTTKGRLAHDYVQEAFKLALTGKRKWNQSSEPDLLKFLKGIIKSCISNAVGGMENKTAAGLSTEELVALGSSKMISNRPSENLILEANEMKARIRLAIIDVDKAQKSPLLLIFDALVDEEMKPREIMEVLELDKAIVQNAIKRIRRITHKILKIDKE